MTRIAQLRKLRGRSLREIRLRGKQQLAKLNERVLGSAEMSDRALVREITPGSRNGNGEGSAMLVLERIRRAPALRFAPSFAFRSGMSAIIRHRFPKERRALLARAERAIQGRFDLLGFSNLSFGNPIDWQLDPTTGKRTPLVHWSNIDYLNPSVAGDKKIIWELNRHAHFVTLGQAYWLTSDECFAEAFVSQATSWMDGNPPKLGINWASSLELAFRVIAWLWALHLFADSDRLTARFVARFFKYLIAQARHIESYLSYYFSPNTHLTGEALGLFYIGAALPEFARARRFRETGLNILLEQLGRHIRNDGTYFEQSSYYHRYTADFYTHLIVLARAVSLGLPREVEQQLSLSLDHLMWITRPDGTSPLYGDDDGGRLLTLNSRAADDFRDTLATGAALFDRGDWKFVAGAAPIELLWLLGPQALEHYDHLSANVPDETSRAFVEGGYFVIRDGWSNESNYLLVDCGPHGSASCGHAHADALSFEYAAEGKTWLVDPGTFTYTGDASLRDYFRSTAAHNTVTVDGESQSVPAMPFSWNSFAKPQAKEFIVGDGFVYFEGSHDGYEKLDDPLTHTRSILYLKKRDCDFPPVVVVRDRFNARARHRYALSYHFAPGCSMMAGGDVIEARSGENGICIRVISQTDFNAGIEEGWVSTCYGQRELAPVAVFETEAVGPQEFVSIIAPCTGRLRPPVTEKNRQQEGAAAEGGPHEELSVPGGIVQIQKGRIEITIHGGSRFGLSFDDRRNRLVVNPFGSQSVPFELEVASLKLTGGD